MKKYTWKESLIIVVSLRKLIDTEEWIGGKFIGEERRDDESRNSGKEKKKLLKRKWFVERNADA